MINGYIQGTSHWRVLCPKIILKPLFLLYSHHTYRQDCFPEISCLSHTRNSGSYFLQICQVLSYPRAFTVACPLLSVPFAREPMAQYGSLPKVSSQRTSLILFPKWQLPPIAITTPYPLTLFYISAPPCLTTVLGIQQWVSIC